MIIDIKQIIEKYDNKGSDEQALELTAEDQAYLSEIKRLVEEYETNSNVENFNENDHFLQLQINLILAFSNDIDNTGYIITRYSLILSDICDLIFPHPCNKYEPANLILLLSKNNTILPVTLNNVIFLSQYIGSFHFYTISRWSILQLEINTVIDILKKIPNEKNKTTVERTIELIEVITKLCHTSKFSAEEIIQIIEKIIIRNENLDTFIIASLLKKKDHVLFSYVKQIILLDMPLAYIQNAVDFLYLKIEPIKHQFMFKSRGINVRITEKTVKSMVDAVLNPPKDYKDHLFDLWDIPDWIYSSYSSSYSFDRELLELLTDKNIQLCAAHNAPKQVASMIGILHRHNELAPHFDFIYNSQAPRNVANILQELIRINPDIVIDSLEILQHYPIKVTEKLEKSIKKHINSEKDRKKFTELYRETYNKDLSSFEEEIRAFITAKIEADFKDRVKVIAPFWYNRKSVERRPFAEENKPEDKQAEEPQFDDKIRKNEPRC